MENDPLYELPKFTDLIEYEISKKTNFMMKLLTQLDNNIQSYNIQDISILLTIYNEAFQPIIENIIIEYGLPLPKENLSLDLKIQDILDLAFLPWDHMVRITFSMTLQSFRIASHSDPTNIESLPINLLPSQDQCYLDQFAHCLVEILYDHKYLLEIFSG